MGEGRAGIRPQQDGLRTYSWQLQPECYEDDDTSTPTRCNTPLQLPPAVDRLMELVPALASSLPAGGAGQGTGADEAAGPGDGAAAAAGGATEALGGGPGSGPAAGGGGGGERRGIKKRQQQHVYEVGGWEALRKQCLVRIEGRLDGHPRPHTHLVCTPTPTPTPTTTGYAPSQSAYPSRLALLSHPSPS